MDKINKKILICGSTGFIGRNLAEYFAKRDDVQVCGTYFESEPLNIPKVKMVYADLRSKEDVDKALDGMDIVIQAAATTSGAKDIFSKPWYHVTDNAVMNAYLFRSAYENNVGHLIFLSCTIMYQSSDDPLKEDDFDANADVNSAYFGGAWTKVYNEKMCEFYSGIGGAKYTVIRHSNIYGPYDKYDLDKSHVFGATMTKVMAAKEGDKVLVWGTGEEERDLLYVSDLVDFIELAIDKQKSKFELLNAGYGSSISISGLVRKIIEHSGKNLDIEYDRTKPSIKTKLSLDTARANKILGWSPKTSIDDGIIKTMTWYKENISCFNVGDD